MSRQVSRHRRLLFLVSAVVLAALYLAVGTLLAEKKEGERVREMISRCQQYAIASMFEDFYLQNKRLPAKGEIANILEMGGKYIQVQCGDLGLNYDAGHFLNYSGNKITIRASQTMVSICSDLVPQSPGGDESDVLKLQLSAAGETSKSDGVCNK